MPSQPAATTAPAALRALLAGIVDYAGLFPPSGLEMPDAVARYAAARNSADAWILGRFVVPTARLEEFEAAAAPWLRSEGEPWRLSALAGPELTADFATIEAFNARHAGNVLIDTAEIRAATAESITAAARLVPAGIAAYFEVPAAADPAPLLEMIRAAHGRAKIRTGGVTADTIPTPADVLRFLAACARLGVPLKATAGLHHPLRAEHALTYEADAPRGTMFGFINVFLAAVFLRDGVAAGEVAPLLEENDAAAVHFSDDAAIWRAHSVPTARIAEAREGFAASFGSCSFDEPVNDLRALGWL